MPKYSFDLEEFEKDLRDFENRLKVLRAEYNQYLNGTLKNLPIFNESQIRRLIKKYAALRDLKGWRRFQYYNLVAKFNTMMEFYGRQVRDRKEGNRALSSGQHPSSRTELVSREKLEEARRKLNPVRSRSHIVSNTANQETTLQELFKEWQDQQKQHADSGTPQLDYNRFRSMIDQKTRQLQEAKGCKAVRYKIVAEQGKIKIKAKAIE